MEHTNLLLGNPEKFDHVIKNSLKEGGLITIITKDNATAQGNPAVMLSFEVEQTDGQLKRVQAVTTVKMFQAWAAALEGRYGKIP